MKKLLEVKNLSVIYQGKKDLTALNNVSLSLKEKEILGVIGESGCGKTTLGFSILNLLPENAKITGEIIYNDRNILKQKEKELCRLRGKDICLIPQDPASSLNPVYSIGFQFDEFLKVKAKNLNTNQRKEKMQEMLLRVKLDEPTRILKSFPHQLSGGQLQRVMIAQAISVNPKILIADEPTSSLDVTVESQLLHMFLNLRNEFNFSIIFVTHNLGIIENLCDRVVVLCSGKIKEAGLTKDIISSPKDEYTKELIGSFRGLQV